MGIFDDIDAQEAARTPTAPPMATIPAGSLFAGLDDKAAAPPPDKYQQAAIAERNRLLSKGVPLPEGYTRRIVQGIPWSDEIAAGVATPFEMARRGVGPGEAYSYAKARENLSGEKARENVPGVLGSALEVTGGLATGAGVLGAGPRLGAVTIGNRTIPARAVNYGANVGKTAGLGGFAGFGEGDTLEDRAKHALVGTALGGTLGAALPPIMTGVGAATRFMQMPRLRDPQKIATEQVAKVARDAGVSMEELANRMAYARAAGQPEFTVADALNKEGQRKLAAMAKVPGPARERITDVLTTRDLNMPHRVGAEIGRKLGAPETAEQASEALIARAGTEAAPLYRQAEGMTTWSPRLQEFWEHPDVQAGMQQGIRMQRRDAVGTGRPFDPNDYAITSFNEAGDAVIGGVPNMRTIQAAKEGLDRMIEAQTDAVTGRVTKEGRSLVGLKNRMLAEVDQINPTYRRARAAYAGPMQVENAVRFGQQMPTQGRAADNLRHFEQMNYPAQQGVRIGYADAVRAPLERTGNFPTILREKSVKGQAELGRLEPYGPATLREALAREEQMQRTSRAALGGSHTAENLADIAQGPSGGEAVGLAANLATGNWLGAGRAGAEMLGRISRGESEAQRSAITRALMARADEPDALRAMQRRIAEHELRRRGVNPWTGTARYPVGQ